MLDGKGGLTYIVDVKVEIVMILVTFNNKKS